MNVTENEKRFKELMDSLPKPNYVNNHLYWNKGKNDYCSVRMWNKSDCVIVLFSQDDANPSISITNGSEHIANAVLLLIPEKWLLTSKFYEAKPIKWFECYECYLMNNEHHFDEINYELNKEGKFCNPTWKYHTISEFSNLLIN